jgi:hypothetical protein
MGDDVITYSMWQFIRASVAAIVGAYKSMPWPEATGYVLGGIRGLCLLIGTEKASRDRYLWRRSRCLACPIYDLRLKTCGTPGVVDAYGNTVGCWCYIPNVAKFSEKKCWMIEVQDERAPKDW